MIFVTHYWLLITRNTNTPSKLKKQKNGSHVTMHSLAIGQFFMCMWSQDQGCGHVLIIPSFHVANLAPFVVNRQVVVL